MDEYTSPLLAPAATDGQPQRHRRRQRRPGPAQGGLQAPRRRPLAGRHLQRVPHPGQRRRQGSDGRRRQSGRPRRPDVEDALRVDAHRLRDLDRGRVTVPIYETSSAEQVQWILSDSGAVACFVETPDHLAVVDEVRGDLGDLDDVWTIDDRGGRRPHRRRAHGVADERPGGPPHHGGRPGDLATIIYTSGHHRTPEGLRAHPRQLPLRGGQRHQREGRRRDPGRASSRTRAPRRCSSSRSPTSSRG